ncbi:MAG: GNAT family N-acetyltransferase [Chloroflexota bacterium]
MPDGKAISVRPAVEADREAIMDVLEEPVRLEQLLPRQPDEVRSNDNVRWWAAEWDGQVVGCVSLEVYSVKLAEIRSLAVAGPARGRGIGARLVAAALEEAHARRVREVLAVTSQEGFFRRLGFGTAFGERIALFWQPAREDIPPPQ